MAPPITRRPAPTAVQRAIQEGFGAKSAAAIDNGIPSEVEPDESVPHDMGHHEAVVFRLQRLEANDIELGRGLGTVQVEVAAISGEMKSLVAYAAKADERAERAEEAKVANDRADRAARTAADAQVAAAALVAKAAEATAKASDKTSDVELAKARMTSREKVYLAIIAVVGTAVAGYFALSHVTLK